MFELNSISLYNIDYICVMSENLYKIGLSLLNGIGPRKAKQLVSGIGSVEGVFKEKVALISKIQGIGAITAQNLKREEALSRAEAELDFIAKNDITSYFYTDEKYPAKLSHCGDAPVMLFSKGNHNFNTVKNIAVVGTRKATSYGKQLVKDLIHDLQNSNVQIVSGLAYGIDIAAHKAALEFGLPTVGVLAHGLDVLYPVPHKSTALQMQNKGGILTEFLSQTIPDKENFPKRNRIVAGMCDATVVVESAEKGGSLITAGLANDYNRDVFAFPGNVSQHASKGCNALIQKNRAHLITCAQDLIEIMGWENQKIDQQVQINLFNDFSPEEEKIISILKEKGTSPIDLISHLSKMTSSELLVQLFNLEMKGVVRSLPGSKYEFV